MIFATIVARNTSGNNVDRMPWLRRTRRAYSRQDDSNWSTWSVAVSRLLRMTPSTVTADTCHLCVSVCLCVCVWLSALSRSQFLTDFDESWHRHLEPHTNKTAELSQRRPRDAPIIWVPWEVLRVLTTHPATFPEICNGLLFRSILRICIQNLKFVALHVPEIIGGTQKIWAVPGYAHAPFSSKILKGFCSDGPCEYTCQIWSS